MVATTKLTEEEYKLLLEHYDTDKSGSLSDDEVVAIVKDYKNQKKSGKKGTVDPRLIQILEKFDEDHDGTLDVGEVLKVRRELDLHHGAARYAGMTAAAARGFRYLAFTSDFGEALRPVMAARIVTGTYMISIGYCAIDVGWEAYKHQKRGCITEKGHHMSLTQLVVERSAFQALASIAVPFLIIHTTVDVGKRLAKRFPNLPLPVRKWGPSLGGLLMVPLLPIVCDEPIEKALEWGFERYGPWAKPHPHAPPSSAAGGTVVSDDKKKH